jgi:hypothetical protein
MGRCTVHASEADGRWRVWSETDAKWYGPFESFEEADDERAACEGRRGRRTTPPPSASTLAAPVERVPKSRAGKAGQDPAVPFVQQFSDGQWRAWSPADGKFLRPWPTREEAMLQLQQITRGIRPAAPEQRALFGEEPGPVPRQRGLFGNPSHGPAKPHDFIVRSWHPSAPMGLEEDTHSLSAARTVARHWAPSAIYRVRWHFYGSTWESIGAPSLVSRLDSEGRVVKENPMARKRSVRRTRKAPARRAAPARRKATCACAKQAPKFARRIGDLEKSQEVIARTIHTIAKAGVQARAPRALPVGKARGNPMQGHNNYSLATGTGEWSFAARSDADALRVAAGMVNAAARAGRPYSGWKAEVWALEDYHYVGSLNRRGR